MKIYDERTGAELTATDLAAGYVYDGVRVVGTEPAHYEVMQGTDGLRRLVPEKTVTEPCQYYHAYTDEEKNPQPTDSQRLDAAEAAIMELASMIGGM